VRSPLLLSFLGTRERPLTFDVILARGISGIEFRNESICARTGSGGIFPRDVEPETGRTPTTILMNYEALAVTALLEVALFAMMRLRQCCGRKSAIGARSWEKD